MILLYLGYWSSADILTQSVIIPRLTILSEFSEIETILFCSIERAGDNPIDIEINKVRHIKFSSQPGKNVLAAKFYDFTHLPSFLLKEVEANNVTGILCNSPLAGAIGYLLWRKTSIPFVVECFEPHAAYMLESGVWSRYDPRYVILRFFEWRQKVMARALLTVSTHYTSKLIEDGVDKEKILTMPNGISLERFQFNNERRNQIRRTLGITSEMITGIYVGKFGDIYYHQEAFSLFAAAFRFFSERFFLIILSSHDHNDIEENLIRINIPMDRVFLTRVPNDIVPHYLSAADFAFSTIKPAPCRLYCCPIKDGEYWANGLPVLLENGIGDDSDIIKNEGGGFLLDMKNPDNSFTKIQNLMRTNRPETAIQIQSIAFKHRRLGLIRDVYTKILNLFL
ncbi:MAG TPA: glycosyltransferase [Chryseolinea sp.]|nr:glycosyltransferase [Chryseolinea sp.]HPM29502.1 glycosyltransferase [Chryseolinea sp.]